MRQLSFTKHSNSIGETYGEHFRVASWFTRTGSMTVMRLHDSMVTNRTGARKRSGVARGDLK